VALTTLHNPRPEFWRHYGSALADLNGDGFPDLILGQSRDTDPTHLNQSSLVLYNDGAGHFPLANRILLPAPAFAGGFTLVNSLQALDVDSDGRLDLILAHNRAGLIGGPSPTFAGRYLQVLMNRAPGNFEDDTFARLGDQSLTTPDVSTAYSEPLYNHVSGIFVTDVNGDGALDLVLNSYFYIGRDAPLVHLNAGDGVFSAMEPDLFTSGQTYFSI
jgi:FG-GAP-like repeat